MSLPVPDSPIDPVVGTKGLASLLTEISNCGALLEGSSLKYERLLNGERKRVACSISVPTTPSSLEIGDEDSWCHKTDILGDSNDIDTSAEDDFDSMDDECDIALTLSLEPSQDDYDNADDRTCDNYCNTATITPTSDDETLFFDDNESYEIDVARDDKGPAVSPECIPGLLLRYIDSTPALQSTAMRLLITKSAIGDIDAIPSQIIRYNTSRAVHYSKLGYYFDSLSIFKGERNALDEIKGVDKKPVETSEEPKTGQEAPLGKLLIVLDLDETLIHMHDRRNDHFDYMVNIVEKEDSDLAYDSTITSNPDIIGFIVHPNMQVSLRPGVVEFMNYLRAHSSLYKVALYTAGTRHYANAILHALDPECEVILPELRHYRDSCEVATTPKSLRGLPATRLGIGNHHRDESVPQFYLKKDLEIFDWPMERLVFFDNSLLSFMNNPENGVWIKPWRGVQPFIEKGMVYVNYNATLSVDNSAKIPGQDRLYEFSQIIELLEELKDKRDVREHLRKKFTLSEIVKEAKTKVDGVLELD